MSTQRKSSKPKDVDVVLLEGEYRSCRKTTSELAREFGIDEAAVRYHARKGGWDKDILRAAKLRAHDLEREAILGIEQPRDNAALLNKVKSMTQEEIIEEVIERSALTQAEVLKRGRQRIDRMNTILENMFEELAAQALLKEHINDIALLISAAEGQSDDVSEAKLERMANSFRKTLALDNRADVAKKLVDSLKNLIGLERQAYGLADNANGEADGKSKGTGEEQSNPAESMTMNEAARRVAFILLGATKKEGAA
jgi:uncharacterized membrane-anchored protein YjiN (DUF445 family)